MKYALQNIFLVTSMTMADHNLKKKRKRGKNNYYYLQKESRRNPKAEF